MQEVALEASMTTTGSGTKRGVPAPLLTAALRRVRQFGSPTPALAAAGVLDTSFDGDGKVTTDFGPGRDDANGIAIYAGSSTPGTTT
jgi:hypothetical protein